MSKLKIINQEELKDWAKEIFQKNSFNKGKMENVYEAVHDSKDNTIIVILDGDDWLANKSVLSYLNNVYSFYDIWMTNAN